MLKVRRRQRLLGVDALREKNTARRALRGTDKLLRHEIGSAIVAGKTDAGEGGRHDGGAGHDAQVAGQRQRQPRAGGPARG